MMYNKLIMKKLYLLFFFLTGFSQFSPLFSEVATDPFVIPSTPPDTVITAERMLIQSSTVILETNVRAVQGIRVLICGRAFARQNPEWLLASGCPRVYQKEPVEGKKMMRETTLDALNISWDASKKMLSASPSVVFKTEERSWDLGTFTEGIVRSDNLEAFPDEKTLHFLGNVSMKGQEYTGSGEKLDYDKKNSEVILSGKNAMVEKEEFDLKERRMVKKKLTGEKIIYNTETKFVQSE
ncbi:MAG: hypothetical protein HQM10_18770 [Candidatus Riflebacteria bacterium]|nr:hypothetical protein [Candidatus Riflebacteria bacterium]